jgi:hypothetical protein
VPWTPGQIRSDRSRRRAASEPEEQPDS